MKRFDEEKIGNCQSKFRLNIGTIIQRACHLSTEDISLPKSPLGKTETLKTGMEFKKPKGKNFSCLFNISKTLKVTK